MQENTQIELTRKELDEGILSNKCNHVIVEIPYSTEGAKTKGGIIVGFNKDILYAEGDDAHNADLQEVWGIVYKCPEKLYYDEKDSESMPWETEMELWWGDRVWFGLIESANAQEILCEGKTYKILPYQDLYVAKRSFPGAEIHHPNYFGGTDPYYEVIPLNGYVLCQTTNLKKMSDLDVISEDKIDKSRAIVRFVGTPNKRYKTKGYSDIEDLQPGDEVMLEARTPLLFLERKKYMASFAGDNLYIILPRRKIIAVINR